VTLDRQSIEKRDFPLTRRGYDQRAVEAHLAGIADALESIQTESRAASAADQVRQIVGAAERSAAEIRRDAADQARDHVATVEQAAERMLERIEAMDAEVSALVESVRSGVKRLKDDLAALRDEVAEAAPREAATPPAPAAAPRKETSPKRAAATETHSREVVSPEETRAEVSPKEAATVEAAASEAPAPPNGASEDEEAARLVALNMALNGASREDARKYLDEQFDVADLDGLLDDVYARAGGS
jgi:chromosome segregation ATPase